MGYGSADTDNPIVQVRLNAMPEDGWVYDYNNEKSYTGFYHLHEDGTAMIGEGTMGAIHTINSNQIILQTNTYDDTYDVYGCMDPEATNYDKLATVDNNSCTYTSEVYGCMDPDATNYDEYATVDNGRCEYIKDGDDVENPTSGDYYYGYYGLEEDAPFNEFTQYIVRKPYAWLVERVPNINNFLNIFSNLINDHNGVIIGGYLRRVIHSGDALQFQNADLDITFHSRPGFEGAVNYINQGNLESFNPPDIQEISDSRRIYNWDLISITNGVPNIKLQLINIQADNIENRLSNIDFTNAKIATNLNEVIIDSRWENFELNKIINIDIVKPDILQRLLKYLYSESDVSAGEPFKLNDSSASKLLTWVGSRIT